MEIHPSREEFERLSLKGNTVPVYMDLTADCETPLGAYAKIRQNGPAFLFESIVGGERISRYSFVGAQPRKIFRIYENETQITTPEGVVETIPTPEDPLSLIENEMAQYIPVDIEGMPPFSGGAVGFVGHEFIHRIEPSVPKPAENPLALPVLYYLLTDSVLIFDHARQVLRICVQVHTESSQHEDAYTAAVAAIKSIYQLLDAPSQLPHRP